MNDKTKLKTASVLAFERKLDPSDALFSAGLWADRNAGATWRAVGIIEKSVRGTISNRLKAKEEQDPAKLDAAIQNPNLQTVDVASLPPDADTLRVRFTLRVLTGVGQPSACNDIDYQHALQSVVADYVQQHGFGELARRYATNLANARFLWRNRIGAEQIEVQIHQLQEGKTIRQWTFDALSLSLREFPTDNAELNALGEVVASGLSGDAHVLLEVIAYARIGAGQEVFPSQELILDSEQKKKKSKTLYQVNDVAGIHSQKIGNALRTIDTWYPQADDADPIAIEPYGSVTTLGKAWRQPKEKVDFYSLLDNWVLKGKAPVNPDDQHFVIAVLIRGGVFGEAN